MKLNLGCAKYPKDGYKNIDISEAADADEFYDIRLGINEEDESVEEVFAGCVLEQMTSEDFKFVLNECHRVLIPGGKLKGYVPSTDPKVLHLDVMDKLFFQEASFKYFDETEEAYKQFGSVYGFKPWRDVKAETNEGGIIHFEMTR